MITTTATNPRTSNSVTISSLTGRTLSTRPFFATSNLGLMRMKKAESRTLTRSLTSTRPIFSPMIYPIMLIGLSKAVLPRSKTKDIAAHAGPSLPSVPSRVPTLQKLENFFPSLNSSSLNAHTANKKQKWVAMVAACLKAYATINHMNRLPLIPCSRAPTRILQALLVTTPPAANTLPPRPPTS